MYATVDSRTHGEKRPCVRHPGCLYSYFVDTTLQAGAQVTYAMEGDNQALLELLQRRLATLELLTQELLASQRAFMEFNLQAVFQHVTQQGELCDTLCRLDHSLMNGMRGMMTQLGSEFSSFSLEALVRQMDPDSARRLRTILDRMEATRVDLRQLNRTQGEFLRRSRRNTDVLLNLAMSYMGTYGPPKSASSPLARSAWSGV